ncbi:MAG: hypothetical protein Fur0037_23160 [Planctomycetota bacterium]
MARPKDATLRARLVEAAILAFAQGGYAGTTLDGIARRAGVTKGGIYFHFRGKEDLFFAALDRARDLRRERAVAGAGHPVAGRARTGAEALRAFVAGYLSFQFEHPDLAQLWKVLGTELRSGFLARLREDDRQELRWLRATCRDLLLQGAHDGTLFVEDPALSAFLIAATLLGVLEQRQVASADVEVFGDASSLAQAILSPFSAGSEHLAGPPEYGFGGAAPT